MSERERFTLVLEAMPDRTPAVIRLRHGLKVLLRSYRLRAVHLDAEKKDTVAAEGNANLSKFQQGQRAISKN